MSGEQIAVWGAQKTLESNGTQITNNALAAASTATYSVEADGLGFPDAEFVLTGTFSVAPTENTLLMLYAQPLAVDGANDTEAPEVSRPTMLIGAFVVNNTSTPQTIVLAGLGFARNLPRNARYYIHNNATGQALAAGWTLKVTPRAYKVAA